MADNLAREPATDEEMRAWVGAANDTADPFAAIREASDLHRAAHGCDLYPSGDGPLLGLLARLAKPARILEVGCGLGYSAVWLAHGAGAAATVDTVEQDPDHIDIAQAAIREHGFAGRINVRHGASTGVLRGMQEPYDLAFFDGDPKGSLDDLDQLTRLVRPGGLLISSNLFLGRYVPGAPWIPELMAYRERLLDTSEWDTVWLPAGKALSVRR